MSYKAIMRYAELKGLNTLEILQAGIELFDEHDIPRDDVALVQIVEELGKEANGPSSELGIIEIPDGIEWQIEDYDGREWVAEKHRIWGDVAGR